MDSMRWCRLRGATGGVAAMVLAEAGPTGAGARSRPKISAHPRPSAVSRSTACAAQQAQQRSATAPAQHPGLLEKPTPISTSTAPNPLHQPRKRGPFVWSRGAWQVGGRQPHLGRDHPAALRHDVQGAARDGLRPCWPIENKDLAPYYGRLSGCWACMASVMALPQLPDVGVSAPLPYNPGGAAPGPGDR